MDIDKTSTIIIFFINGVNSLIGWSVVLAALDFFADSFTQYNVYSFLPVPLFVGYLTIAISFHQISNRFKYRNIIIVGNMIVNISLILILLVGIYIKQTIHGFILLLCCSFMIGIGGNLSQLVFFAMINYLSQSVVSKFTIGTAVSGLFIASIRAIIVGIFGSQDTSNKPIIIYFVIALVFNTMDLLMNVYFCSSSVYKHKIDHFLLHHDKEKDGEQPNLGHQQKMEQDNQKNTLSINNNQDQIKESVESDTQEEEPITQEYVHEEERIENQNYFKTLYQTCLKIAPYPYIILGDFVITFTLFPGPTYHKTFQHLDSVWTVIIFAIVYNIGDTIGKYLPEVKGIFNHKSLIYIFFCRIFFIFPITFMATGADKGDVLTDNYFFPFFNQLLFAITNGFCINASFIMAFKTCPLTYKKYAGVLCGLLLQIGIMVGTILEIPYAYIIKIN